MNDFSYVGQKPTQGSDVPHRMGGRLIKRARYYWLLLAESPLTRRLFGAMVRRIELLPLPAGWSPLPVGRISGTSKGEAEVSESSRGHGSRCWLTPSRRGTVGSRRTREVSRLQACGCERAGGTYTAVAEDAKTEILAQMYIANRPGKKNGNSGENAKGEAP